MKQQIAHLAKAAFPFVAEIHTRYTDEDHMGHVNNIAVATYYDEARSRFTQAVRAKSGDLTGLRLVTAQANVTYLAEVFQPDVLRIGCGIVRIGGSSYEIGQALYQNGRCAGVCTAVFVNATRPGASPLPENLRAALRDFLLDPAALEA
jgi:acyl-CoA thioester hydrolase